MPELPEVEIVKQILLPQLKGHTIARVIVRNAQVIACPDAEAFALAAEGATILTMRRRGKYLLLDLLDGNTITVHLRMTGQLLVTPRTWPEHKHTHLILQLKDQRDLRFVDVRRFGRLWLLETGHSDTVTGVQRLGVEPFDPRLTAHYLKAGMGKRKITVKQALLDQSVVAGIGNIYADEILHLTGIHPQRTVAELSTGQWAALAETIPTVMRAAIDQKRISAEAYLHTAGREYQTEPFLLVYGRAGKACPHCGTLVERLTIAGRSSHYCPTCQKND